MAFKIVINEPKARKSYQIEKDIPSLIGMKIGQKFDGSMLGLSGLTLQVTGGSDKEGFPMKPDLEGSGRKKILMTKGVGFRGTKTKKVKGKKKKDKVKGLRKRKYVCCNQITDSIMQVNCKIVEGEGDIGMMLGLKKEEAPKEEVKEAPKEEEKKAKEEVNSEKKEAANKGEEKTKEEEMK